MGLLKLPEKKPCDIDFVDENLNPQEDAADEDRPVRPHRLRPEMVMGIVAVLAAVLLAAVLIPSLPYMFRDEDPEAAKAQNIRQTEPQEEVILEPTISETEPENPTIPPERNPYDRFDFQYNRHNYLLLQNVKSYPGVDVSAFQGNIDWKQVKQSGIDFAIIRVGYRGYGAEGKMVEDKLFHDNIKGAREAGIRVGVYFFSQATSVEEALEEADFVLERIGKYEIDMPVVFDWEYVSEEARTANVDPRTLTDCYLAFCGRMEEEGYTPMPYFNSYQSRKMMYLTELEQYPFWLALYSDRMTYPYRVEMWQYTDSGKVPGIEGNVDINLMFTDEYF